MFALLALICFVLALFRVHLGSVDLVVLGFCFVALHLMYAVALPLPGTWRRNPPPG